MRAISPARKAAFHVLETVSSGSYASDAIRHATASLSPRDAGLARQIVFGCLRYQLQLDHLIAKYSGKQADKLDVVVAIALRVGIFQMRHLERIPPHAAVHDSVEFVKHRKRAASGLTNAVLRKVNRLPVVWPDAPTELSCPGWLLARWSAHFSEELSRQMAGAALVEPLPYIRVPPGQEPPAGLELEATPLPGAYRLLSPALPGIRLHDIGSQSIVPLLALEPGLRYLDLCAAPGNKTFQALETPSRSLWPATSAPSGFVIFRRSAPGSCSMPLSHCLSPLRSIVFSSMLPVRERAPWHAIPRSSGGSKRATFRVLPKKQLQIARQAVVLLAPGGKLVYATCSLEREENEDIVHALLEEQPDLVLERESWRLPGRDEGDGFFAAVLSKS